jgi:hypothetical protein
MMYSTPQLLDEHIWVPVRDLFIQQCGHAGYSVLEGIRDGLNPPREMWEAAERGLLLPSLSLRALDPAGSVPGTWRDWAVQAGRPSPLLCREALMAREAAANQGGSWRDGYLGDVLPGWSAVPDEVGSLVY